MKRNLNTAYGLYRKLDNIEGQMLNGIVKTTGKRKAEQEIIKQ